ncbi:hypothetical protein [Nocardiopsis sp. CNR-923]|uniref:hypothetical protein n=1 Tax=Nocardiopsis sp. CNR-923 TaxID=1904965 RepID=UPI00117DF0C1|nr:hypothetical protein [Nocardiopsis sp. CNR-923]
MSDATDQTSPAGPYRPTPITPLPEPPPAGADELAVLEWAAEVHRLADENLTTALANAYANTRYPVAEIHARSPFSKVPTERRVRERGVPPRPRGGLR